MWKRAVVGAAFVAVLGLSFAPSSANAASCCVPNPLPMCDDAMVMLCVCMIDMNCCMFGWDATCVAEVILFGCGTCGCQPNCGGKVCGDDGCGGSCGQCFGTQICQNGGCIQGCTPNCAGKQCGADGCGGICGQCQFNFTCVADQCQANCQPQCQGVQCGPDGCGGSCGSCGFGEVCSEGSCQAACEPQCAGKQCGSDGCGGLCGSCGVNEACNPEGQCFAMCQSQCLGKECGDDGCGGLCGSCGLSAMCSPEGFCVPKGEPAEDLAGEADVSAPIPEDDSREPFEPSDEPDAQNGTGPTTCPAGHSLLYGKCVPDSQSSDEDAGSADSGCTAGPYPTSTDIPLLVLLVMLLSLGVRGHRLARR